MADRIIMPPVPDCGCAFCTKRREELRIAERMTRELHSALQAELDSKRRTFLLEREAGPRRWSFSNPPAHVESRQRVRKWQ